MIKPTALLFVFLAAAAAQAGPATPGRPDPCASQYQTYLDADAGRSTLNADEAKRAWEKCEANIPPAHQTAKEWASSLAPLAAGGWEFLMVSSDGTQAFFGSHRHASRDGNLVTLWMRYEFRQAQIAGQTMPYRSEVVRTLFDCARVASKALAETFYGGNNLDGEGNSIVLEESKVQWSPVIPGTIGDTLLDWACTSTPKAAESKKQ